jgi:hypothetical protein
MNILPFLTNNKLLKIFYFWLATLEQILKKRRIKKFDTTVSNNLIRVLEVFHSPTFMTTVFYFTFQLL